MRKMWEVGRHLSVPVAEHRSLGNDGHRELAGVSTAIVLGVAGALFWMWLTAIIGMATKYAEVVLALKYKVRITESWGRESWNAGMAPPHESKC